MSITTETTCDYPTGTPEITSVWWGLNIHLNGFARRSLCTEIYPVAAAVPNHITRVTIVPAILELKNKE